MDYYKKYIKYKKKYMDFKNQIISNQSAGNSNKTMEIITFIDLCDSRLSNKQKNVLNILNKIITEELCHTRDDIIYCIKNMSFQKFIIYYNEGTYDIIKNIGESPFSHGDIEQTKHAIRIISKVLAKYGVRYEDNKYVYDNSLLFIPISINKII